MSKVCFVTKIKKTNHTNEYLMTKENIEKAEPKIIFSAHFMCVQTDA